MTTDTQRFEPKHTDAGTFDRLTTINHFWERETNHNRRVRSGVRGFMFAAEDYEILNLFPARDKDSFQVDYVLPNNSKGSAYFAGDTRVTIYKAEPDQPAQPDKHAGNIFMLNMITGQVDSCDPLRWDSYPLHWRQIDRAAFDWVSSEPTIAAPIVIQQIKDNDAAKLASLSRPEYVTPTGGNKWLGALPVPHDLPPARMVAVKPSDLVEAVRNLYMKPNGQVDEFNLWRFIQDVLKEQTPAPSPDPAPLVAALEAIESGYVGDMTPGYVAAQGLIAYREGQTLTIPKPTSQPTPDPMPLLKFVKLLANGETFVNVQTAAQAVEKEYYGGK